MNAPATVPPSPSEFEPRIHILVIGDDLTHRLHFRNELSRAYLEEYVLFVNDPWQALPLLQEENGVLAAAELHAIFINEDCPHLSWVDLLRALKASPATSDIPVFLLAQSPAALAKEANRDLSGSLAKPVWLQPFVKLVAQAFRQRHPHLCQAA